MFIGAVCLRYLRVNAKRTLACVCVALHFKFLLLPSERTVYILVFVWSVRSTTSMSTYVAQVVYVRV